MTGLEINYKITFQLQQTLLLQKIIINNFIMLIDLNNIYAKAKLLIKR